MKRRAFVTEAGLISPLGNSWQEFERRMFAGESGISSILGRQVAENFPVPYAGVVNDSSLPEAEALGLPPSLQSNNLRYAMLAAMQCLERVSKEFPVDTLIYGTAGGVYFELVADQFREPSGGRLLWDRSRSELGAETIIEAITRRQLQPVGAANVVTMNSACASGTHAIGMAWQRVLAGRSQRSLVVTVDSGAWPSQLMNFYLLQALSVADVPAEKASCPFSKRRAGFIKSEAAAAVLVESTEAAKARGAKPLAEICGFGLTNDAFRITDGRDDGSCVARAMELAMESAGLAKEQISYINAHGTSTPLNDRVETLSIKKAFGDLAYRIPVSSLKSQVGHSTVAAGGLEAVACLSMLKEQKLAPTINLDEADPECDLDYVPNVSRSASVEYILSNNLGFGGQNASLILGKV